MFSFNDMSDGEPKPTISPDVVKVPVFEKCPLIDPLVANLMPK